MRVFAAGALLWRMEENELKVALIHRGRYDDWSWPKGKVDAGETLPEAAVREIREETGLKIRLGVPLGVQRYKLANNNQKIVHYWAAEVSDEALEKSTFKPSEEVSAVHWFTAAEAKEKLSYSHDQEQLEQLLALFEKKMLRTKPVVILRHGKARARATWKDGEASRPLLTEGNAQAEALPKMLKAFGAKTVFSSPWTRCLSTIAPYAQSTKVKVKTSPEFTETANEKKPAETKFLFNNLINLNKSIVICTHRPVLPTMIEVLETRSEKRLKENLDKIAILKPGSFSVVHFSDDPDPILRVIVDVEFHSPLGTKKK
jgi:8-oxo-dGTP diphosphatase